MVSELVSEPIKKETVMTIKAVTTAQLEQVRKMANDKGISKDEFQRALDSGSVATMLDGMRTRKTVESLISLLTQIGTVEVPAVERFNAEDHFGDANLAGIKFWLSDDFRRHFLGKVEENVPGATLAIHRLNRNSRNGPIRKELGSKREETALAHFYELIKLQPRGEAGKLLTNGYAKIIFYICDANGNFWAVYAYWYSFRREWRVLDNSVESPIGWDAGFQIVSRK